MADPQKPLGQRILAALIGAKRKKDSKIDLRQGNEETYKRTEFKNPITGRTRITEKRTLDPSAKGPKQVRVEKTILGKNFTKRVVKDREGMSSTRDVEKTRFSKDMITGDVIKTDKKFTSQDSPIIRIKKAVEKEGIHKPYRGRGGARDTNMEKKKDVIRKNKKD